MTTAPWKLVTPEQLAKGWLENIDGCVRQRSFCVVRRLADGNYVVRNPELVLLEEADPPKGGEAK